MKIDELNYIDQLRMKNEKALEYVIDNYGWIIKTVVKKHLYNLTNVQEECINDILLGIWNNISSFNKEKSDFKNWVAGIAKFKCIDYKRKYLRDLENGNLENITLSAKDFTEDLLKNEISEEIQSILNCLGEKDKDIFYKLYVEEMDMQQVIKETGIKQANIYNRLSRAKKKIKQRVNYKKGVGGSYER